MEKNVINTESKLFKLYAARRLRVGRPWDIEEVLQEPTNVCHYVRNFMLEIVYQFFAKFFIFFVSFLLATFMVLTPILSIAAWLLTDNPFIVWFGVFGEMMLVVDIIIFIFIGGGAATYFTKEYFNSLKNKQTPVMNTLNIAGDWVKGHHGKFCKPLTFDRKSKLDQDD